MFKIVLIAAVLGCALAAPAPYDNPPKSGTVQEISKYHVTEQNKQSGPVTHNAPSLKPSAIPATAHPAAHADVPAVNTGVVGPTPVPVTSHPAASLRANREADHTQEHKEEELKKKEEEKFGKPKDVKAHITGPTPVPLATHSATSLRQKREADHTDEHKKEELKKKVEEKSDKPEDAKKVAPVSSIHKRESVSEKEESKPQVNVKVPTEHSRDHACGSSCTKEHQHPKSDATDSSAETNAKHLVLPPKNANRNQNDRYTTPRAIVKREDSTTEKAPASTTHGHLHQLTPTSVHSSFSHTWTRPEAQPAVEAHKADDKEPAASDNKPIIATIDPLKPVNDAKTSTTTGAPSTTPSVRRVRRGTDETEEQDEPKGPKPTKAWWRSLDLNKKEEVPKKADTVPSVHVKEADNKQVVTSYAAPAVVERKQKRETDEEKKPSTGTPVTSTQKPNRGLEQAPQEVDNKPPQFIHPVPVAQILGQKQADLTAVKQSPQSSERSAAASSKEEAKKQSAEKASDEKHDNPHAFQKHQSKQD